MGFRFRLTFSHVARGFLHFEEPTTSFTLDDGLTLTLAARDAGKLAQASRFHLEACGFPDEATARQVGERLRLRLRVLNAMLNLGFKVPAVDTVSVQCSSTAKEEVLRKSGGVVVDSVAGLNVFPDDGNYCEIGASGTANVYPNDPTFLFKALAAVWSIEMQFDERVRDTLEILSNAVNENSLRIKFLLTYLAAERMIDCEERSEAARELIARFQQCILHAGLDKRETNSLLGAFRSLNMQSFSSALSALAHRQDVSVEVNGIPIRKLVSECIEARNSIVHNATLNPEIDLQNLSDALRQFVIMLLWTTYQLPSISIDIPASACAIEKMTLRAI